MGRSIRSHPPHFCERIYSSLAVSLEKSFCNVEYILRGKRTVVTGALPVLPFDSPDAHTFLGYQFRVADIAHEPDIPAAAVVTGQQPPVDDHPATETGAEGKPDEVPVTHRIPGIFQGFVDCSFKQNFSPRILSAKSSSTALMVK